MGDTDVPSRQPELAAESLATSTLLHTCYRPLVRLAALLTGDAGTAETVACAALRSRPVGSKPSTDAVRHLQQQVLARCRRYERTRTAPAATATATATTTDATDFAQLPVVRALQDLPQCGREAVVLTLYLDLSEQQAAVVAGVTQAVLRERLGRAMRTLQDRFPAG